MNPTVNNERYIIRIFSNKLNQINDYKWAVILVQYLVFFRPLVV